MLRKAKLKMVMTIVPHGGEHSAGCFAPSASALTSGLRLEHRNHNADSHRSYYVPIRKAPNPTKIGVPAKKLGTHPIALGSQPQAPTALYFSLADLCCAGAGDHLND